MPSFPTLLIVFATDDLKPCDQTILEALNSMSLDVEVESENDADIETIVDQSLIVISPSVLDQAGIADQFRNVAVPIISFTKDAYVGLGMTTNAGSGEIELDEFDLGEIPAARVAQRIKQRREQDARKVKLSQGQPTSVAWVQEPGDVPIIQGFARPVKGIAKPQCVLFARKSGAPKVGANDTFTANRVGFPMNPTMPADALQQPELGEQFVEAVKWATGYADTNAYKVLLVVHSLRSLSDCEVAIDRALLAQKYEVQKKPRAQASCLDARGKSLVILSPSVRDQKAMGEKFREVAVPVICFSQETYLAMGMADVSERQECTSFEVGQGENRRFTHPLTANLIGTVEFVDRARRNLSYVEDLPPNSSGIGSLADAVDLDHVRYVLFGCRAGQRMFGGDELFPARRVGFPLVEGMTDNCLANDPANKLGLLFAAALTWAVGEINTRQFDEVFKEEWQEIYKRRLFQLRDPSLTGIDGKHAPQNLVGLALSGGGIRSATFALGVLQALNELKLLSLFDYLSTVSGGGYVGGWWSAYLSRRDFDSEHSIFPSSEGIEPERLDNYRRKNTEQASEGAMSAGRDPIHHLRLFANYLTPRKGILSGDTWRAIAVVTRNLLLTWVMLLPILFSAVVAAQSVFMLRDKAREHYLRDYRADVEAVYSARNAEISESKAQAERMKLDQARTNQDLHVINAMSDIEISRIESKADDELAALRSGYRTRLLERASFIAMWFLAPFAAMIVVMLAAFMRSNSAIPYLVKLRDRIRGYKVDWGFEQAAVAHLLGALFVGITIFIFSALVWQQHSFFPKVWVASANLSIGGVITSITEIFNFRLLLGAAGFAALVTLVVLYTFPWKRVPGPTSRTGEELRRGVWRNRITKVHSTSLVVMVLVAAVLGFAGFGHDLFDYIFRDAAPRDWLLGYVTKAGGWITVIGATVGAVFTTLKSAPTAGKDSGDLKEPPMWQKAVFAVTPPLVMITLMVLFAWLANHAASSLGLREGYPWPLTGLITSGIILASFLAQMEIDKPEINYLALKFLSLGVLVAAILAVPIYVILFQTPVYTFPLIKFSILVGVLILFRNCFAGNRWLIGWRRFEVKPLAQEKPKSFEELRDLRFKRITRFWLYFAIAVILVAFGWWATDKWQAATDALRVSEPSTYPVGGRWWLTFKAAVGIALCPILLVLEAFLGKGENRRTRVLIAAVFIVSLLLLLISFDVDAPNNRARFAFVSLGLLVGSLTWVLAIGWMADPNAISMHGFYRARLIRAYLGASNAERQKDNAQITDTAVGDDVLLKDMRNCERGAPYHLLNTTLNLTAGRDLATAQRSSAMFVLSRLYCGSFRTGFQRSSGYAAGSLTLGMAVATSGAAVSPGMGSGKTTSSQAMLMTLMNIRLGFWTPTPSGDAWRLPQARLWPYYSLREFLSQTNDLSSYCYLTDGGHFDNLGLYSLVERGCRFIVAVDAVADPVPCFSDLGNVIRRCRIDFNVEIKLDITAFQRSKDDAFAKQHFEVGEIVYTEEHAKTLGWRDTSLAARTGVIVYVKSSLLKNETNLGADVRQYGIENSDFPQQSTVDQWFDEAQFESYRQLGRLSILEAFEEARLDLDQPEAHQRRAAPQTKDLWLELQQELAGLKVEQVQAASVEERLANAPVLSPAAAARLFELVKRSRV